MAFWLMKSEPETYGWDDLIRDGETEWDGVRNNAAAFHLRAMDVGDQALFYHSGEQKAAVGVMEIVRAWRPDGPDGKFASVKVKAREPLPLPVTLKSMKADARLAGLETLRQSRLSVSPVRDAEWAAIIDLAETG